MENNMEQNKKFDVIVVGELNVDLILNQIDGFPEVGKEKLADQMTLTLGSSSAIFFFDSLLQILENEWLHFWKKYRLHPLQAIPAI